MERGKDGKERGIRIEWFEDEVKLITIKWWNNCNWRIIHARFREEKYKIFFRKLNLN